ncbi:hypothetical protein HHI36_018897 [Cryptolaemus montrouzieri]|uniref:Uncharacterized protein n=1 Tax=Cryptolaemus montrouzieri TaxID=559131 RepID=A0ABD2P230_9CUCU
MFDILHPPAISNCTFRPPNVDLNFRRRRTDIISVESLNYCKKLRISSTQTTNRIMASRTANKNEKKKENLPVTPININVRVLRDECDCSLKKKRKSKQGDEEKETECYCSDGIKKKEESELSAIQEEFIGKKNVKTVEATALGQHPILPRKEATFEKMITYNVRGRSISDAAGFDWTKTYWVSDIQ